LQDCAESFGDLFSGTAYFGPEGGPLGACPRTNT
jgi:hypothetical protein